MVKKMIKKIKESAAKKKATAAAKKKTTSAKKKATVTTKKKVTAKPKKTVRKTLSSSKRKLSKIIETNDLFELIEKEAYYLYEKRGTGHGNDQDDWYLAEKKVRTLIKK